jgi:hypothetical protein
MRTRGFTGAASFLLSRVRDSQANARAVEPAGVLVRARRGLVRRRETLARRSRGVDRRSKTLVRRSRAFVRRSKTLARRSRGVDRRSKTLARRSRGVDRRSKTLVRRSKTLVGRTSVSIQRLAYTPPLIFRPIALLDLLRGVRRRRAAWCLAAPPRSRIETKQEKTS